ncbi:MAG: hypothetical protein ACRDQX_12130 [Pseudonocardiaceae bacterium]
MTRALTLLRTTGPLRALFSARVISNTGDSLRTVALMLAGGGGMLVTALVANHVTEDLAPSPATTGRTGHLREPTLIGSNRYLALPAGHRLGSSGPSFSDATPAAVRAALIPEEAEVGRDLDG